MEQTPGLAFRALRPMITHIAGSNPSMASLLGSNVFIVGHHQTEERIMIDSGDISANNEGFLNNLRNYLDSLNNPKSYISKILLTHGHQDHFGGANDVVRMLQKRGQKTPEIYKMIDDN